MFSFIFLLFLHLFFAYCSVSFNVLFAFVISRLNNLFVVSVVSSLMAWHCVV